MENILVTGGAGFIGTNLIKRLRLEYPDAKIVSLDCYLTGTSANHLTGVEYIYGDTMNSHNILAGRTFDTVYHFGEYSRVVQSFEDIQMATDSIMGGTPRILELCREWNAKLIYSASSSKFGNDGKDENLAPYSWMKAKMVELIKNYGDWFGLEYQINYFFNVYGPVQITHGDYATVVGIFERQYLAGKPCTVVTPGDQSRDFTHVDDIIEGVIKSTQYKDPNMEWYLRSGVNRTIIEVAEMFGEFKFIPERKGERVKSTLITNDTNKLLGLNPKDRLPEWIDHVKKQDKVS
jgi:UDP-glucose 4-epimerase|tara:strand:+ start:656 stop:1531 length:876 start_codon:yes stop_codon:yes gene_type:complete